jgi:hypothetical protein
MKNQKKIMSNKQVLIIESNMAYIEFDVFGTKRYYKNGELHRDGDEPAVIGSDGTIRYYKNGVEYTKEQVEKMEEIRRRILNKNVKSCARYWYDKTFMNPYNFKNENLKKSIKNKQLLIMHNSMVNKRVEFMRKKIFGNGNKKISSLDRSRTIELINEEVDKMKVGVRFWRNDECQTIKEKLYKINNNYWDVQELEEVLNDIEEPKDEDYANILLDLKSSCESPSLEYRVKNLEDRVEYLEDRIRYLLQISIYE